MSLPFTRLELADAIQRGEITARSHPSLPYTIYNYTPEVQYSNRWNDITLNCRGLILDCDFNIVARPWKKFFNLGQVDLPIQMTDPVEVMDKADGSLGILYNNAYNYVEGNLWVPDSYAIATRGSFESEQAIHATKVWNENYSHLEVPRDYTFLFEIVYPENRIVLNYDGMDDLILLGAVEKATGYYIGPKAAEAMLRWPGYVVDVMPFNTISAALGHMARSNAEGYVIRSHNFMVKLKQPDYLELHRLVTNMTPKSIWEQLRAGKSVDEIIANLPDEFHSMAEDIAKPLVHQYAVRLDEIFEGYTSVMDSFMSDGSQFDRGRFARSIQKAKDKAYYFALLDEKPITDMLWKELRPKETAVEWGEKV